MTATKKPGSPAPAAPAPQRRYLAGLLLLLALILAQSLFASHLNRLFYSKFAPFYDSAAYTNSLALHMDTARQSGPLAALATEYSNNTVLLPWLEAIALSPFIPPSRALGVWMQSALLFLLAAGIFLYFHHFRQAGFLFSVLAPFPFISFRLIYEFNGGLSDFRMDLTLFCLYSAVLLAYLTTTESPGFRPWLLTAALALLCLLSRATAPAYLAFALGPVLLARLAASDPNQRRALLYHALTAFLPLALIATTYLSSKWRFLHYYYFVWGPDPTARLPFLEGLHHFRLAAGNAGSPILLACLATLAVTLALSARADGWRTTAARLDLRLLWFAVAPPLLLALQGAGYNPFAAMPALFGFFLFCLAPLRGPLAASPALRLALLLPVAAALYNTSLGVPLHTLHNHLALIQPYKDAFALMHHHARAAGLRSVQFDTTHLAGFDAVFLRNVIRFDSGGLFLNGAALSPDGIAFRSDFHASLSGSAEINWSRELPGRSDSEKSTYLANLASSQIDFLFLPDPPTLTWLETNLSHNFINRKTRLIRQRLLDSGLWRPSGPLLRVSPSESVQLYVNRNRVPSPR